MNEWIKPKISQLHHLWNPFYFLLLSPVPRAFPHSLFISAHCLSVDTFLIIIIAFLVVVTFVISGKKSVTVVCQPRQWPVVAAPWFHCLRVRKGWTRRYSLTNRLADQLTRHWTTIWFCGASCKWLEIDRSENLTESQSVTIPIVMLTRTHQTNLGIVRTHSGAYGLDATLTRALALGWGRRSLNVRCISIRVSANCVSPGKMERVIDFLRIEPVCWKMWLGQKNKAFGTMPLYFLSFLTRLLY